MIARHLAQRHVDRRGGIGRVDDPADVFWESKQRDHAGEVASARTC